MSYFRRDLIKIILFSIVWIYLYSAVNGNFKEILLNLPFYLIISLGYYAVLEISLNIMNISNF